MRAPVRIESSSLVLTRNGRVAVRVRCLATESCAVTVALRSASRLMIAGKKRIVFLGSAKQEIGAGDTARVWVRLTPQSRALAERLGTLKVRATVVSDGRVSRTLVLKAR